MGRRGRTLAVVVAGTVVAVSCGLDAVVSFEANDAGMRIAVGRVQWR